MGRDLFLTLSTSAKSVQAVVVLPCTLPLRDMASSLSSSVVFCLLSLFKLSEIAAVLLPFLA